MIKRSFVLTRRAIVRVSKYEFILWTEFFRPLIFLWRCSSISKNRNIEVNGQIRDRKLRVVSEDGEQLGIMSAKEALEKAEDRNLDLVKIAPMANPPVVKIMDYGKYLFEINKREKENKKKQKVVEIKEIRLSVNIDTHDFETKAGHAKRFIEHGDKVKVSIRFRGREMAHKANGTEVMNRFADFLEDCAEIEKAPKLEGRQMLMFLVPKKQK